MTEFFSTRHANATVNGAISLLVLLASSNAMAQISVDSQAGNNLVLEEILVSASRRVENLQEVPMSVTAFSSDFFQDAGVNQLADLEQYTPNFSVSASTDSRSTMIRIRGIGSVGTNTGVDPSVGVFIDGIYQGRAGMSISDLVDVQRVEILRGPQGTLYGKNTSAGAISVVTNNPGAEFESMLELGYDSNEQVELRGMVNVPLGSTGNGLRLSGFRVERDHLFENSYTGKGVNDADKYGARGKLLIDLTGSHGSSGLGELIVSADFTREDTDCCAFAVIDYEGLSPLNSPGTNSASDELQSQLGLNALGQPILQYSSFEDSEGFSPPPAAPFGKNYWFDEALENEVEVGGVSLEWNTDLANESTLTFINAWRHYKSDSTFDGDFTAYNAVGSTTNIALDQYSSELRLTSPGGQTIDYQGGLYAYYSELESLGTFIQHPSLVNNISVGPGVTLGSIFPDGTTNIDDNQYTTTSYAAFGQLVWNYTDSLSLTLGLRYTYEKKERVGSQLTLPSFPVDIPPIAGPDIFLDNKRSDSDVSPMMNVRYFLNSDVMTYASVSRGFKSGGFNQRREVSTSTGEFDEEIATNYEMGWKASFFDRRLQFNGTFFYVDYEDFQSQTFDGSTVRVTNAGNLESYGTELELVFIPVVDMTIGTAIGYNKAEYDSFDNGQCTIEQTFYQYYVVEGAQMGSPATDSGCTQDLGGQPLANAPEWTISSYLQYDVALAGQLRSVFRLEHSYIDEFFLDEDLDDNLVNDSVDLVNLRVTLTDEARNWEAALWGRNLLDEEYYAFGLDIPTLGGYAGVVAPEASYGISLRWYMQ